jgi:hypothetical protein
MTRWGARRYESRPPFFPQEKKMVNSDYKKVVRESHSTGRDGMLELHMRPREFLPRNELATLPK